MGGGNPAHAAFYMIIVVFFIIFATDYKGAVMATYTITVNERTKAGKSLVHYLRSLGVINEPNDATIAAAMEIRNGGGTRCKSFEDYLNTVSAL